MDAWLVGTGSTDEDPTNRQARIVVGVQRGDELLVDVLASPPPPTTQLGVAPLRHALPLPIERDVVRDCLGIDERVPMFERAWYDGVGRLSRRERNLMAGVTGDGAESVAAVLLVEHGWHVLW